MRQSWLEHFGTVPIEAISFANAVWHTPSTLHGEKQPLRYIYLECWSAHNILSLGYEYAHEYEKPLASLEIAKSLGGWQESVYRDASSSIILERFDRLYDIVHCDKEVANKHQEWTLWNRENS